MYWNLSLSLSREVAGRLWWGPASWLSSVDLVRQSFGPFFLTEISVPQSLALWYRSCSCHFSSQMIRVLPSLSDHEHLPANPMTLLAASSPVSECLWLENPRTSCVLLSALFRSQAFVRPAVCQHGARNPRLLLHYISLLWTSFSPHFLLFLAAHQIATRRKETREMDSLLIPHWRGLSALFWHDWFPSQACFLSSASFIEVP